MQNRKAIAGTVVGAALLAAVYAYAQSKGGHKLTADDYMEIYRIYSKYNWSTDSRNGSAKADLFTPDGVFQVVSGGKIGRTEVGHERLTASVLRELGPATQTSPLHFVMNVSVEPTADGGAHGGAYMLNVTPGEPGQPATVTTLVFYEDWLVKTPEGWRIKLRRSLSEGGLGASTIFPPVPN
jgi:hypothetical protein